MGASSFLRAGGITKHGSDSGLPLRTTIHRALSTQHEALSTVVLQPAETLAASHLGVMQTGAVRQQDRDEVAAATQGGGAEAGAVAIPARRYWVVAALMVVLPLLAGLAWYVASDDPLWPVFRSTLNLCSMQQAQASPVSPDGRYRVHVVQAVCMARFPETMVFVSEASEAFSTRELDPNRAVLEVAGDRTLDAAFWVGSGDATSGRMMLRLDLVRGAEKHQVHRVEDHWRDVPVVIGESKPAPGAEKLGY